MAYCYRYFVYVYIIDEFYNIHKKSYIFREVGDIWDYVRIFILYHHRVSFFVKNSIVPSAIPYIYIVLFFMPCLLLGSALFKSREFLKTTS